MTNDLESLLRLGEWHLARASYREAVEAADKLVSAGDIWILDALPLRAAAYERWIDGPPDRILRAIEDWIRVAALSPVAVVFQNLARLQLKQGDYPAAFECLRAAEKRRPTPELWLGFAEYYLKKHPPDLSASRAYYLRSALRGRIQGVRGYVEVSLMQDKPIEAVLMTAAGVILSPLLAIFLGDRRHQGL